MNRLKLHVVLTYRLYVDLKKVNSSVRQYLCPKATDCVNIKDYNYTVLRDDIKDIVNKTTDKIWVGIMIRHL